MAGESGHARPPTRPAPRAHYVAHGRLGQVLVAALHDLVQVPLHELEDEEELVVLTDDLRGRGRKRFTGAPGQRQCTEVPPYSLP